MHETLVFSKPPTMHQWAPNHMPRGRHYCWSCDHFQTINTQTQETPCKKQKAEADPRIKKPNFRYEQNQSSWPNTSDVFKELLLYIWCSRAKQAVIVLPKKVKWYQSYWRPIILISRYLFSFSQSPASAWIIPVCTVSLTNGETRSPMRIYLTYIVCTVINYIISVLSPCETNTTSPFLVLKTRPPSWSIEDLLLCIDLKVVAKLLLWINWGKRKTPGKCTTSYNILRCQQHPRLLKTPLLWKYNFKALHNHNVRIWPQLHECVFFLLHS